MATLLESALKETQAHLETVLDQLLPQPQGPEARVLKAMRYATLGGGKRIRAFLTLQSGRLFGVDRRALSRTAAALECVHAYSLVHDDLPAMDDDDLRRGRPTTHKKFDEATAILAGDALLTHAFMLLADTETHPDPHVRAELCLRLAQAAGAGGMVGGQMIDMACENAAPDMATITRLQRMKTGALIVFAAEAGAIMGRASQQQRHALTGYAQDLGLAFQMVDDLLDETGNAAEAGKAVGKDATRGKATFVAALGLERTRAQAEALAHQAPEHLAEFDGRADLLRALPAYVLARKH